MHAREEAVLNACVLAPERGLSHHVNCVGEGKRIKGTQAPRQEVNSAIPFPASPSLPQTSSAGA